MARVTLNEQYLQDTANAIRSKTGSSGTYTPAQFASAIGSIDGGKTVILTLMDVSGMIDNLFYPPDAVWSGWSYDGLYPIGTLSIPANSMFAVHITSSTLPTSNVITSEMIMNYRGYYCCACYVGETDGNVSFVV